MPESQSASSTYYDPVTCAIVPVCDQGMQRSDLLVDNNELDLLADLHTQADLGEWCAPVGWQFSFLIVKPGLASWKVIRVLVTPKSRAVMKRFLK